MNETIANAPPSSQADDSKEQVAICLQREALDRITGRDWSDLNHSPTTNSTSHNAEQQDGTFPAAYFTAPGTHSKSSPSCSIIGCLETHSKLSTAKIKCDFVYS